MLGDGDGVTYQASSPDEVAIVRFTESVGLTLVSRDRTTMGLRTPDGTVHEFQVLDVFPVSPRLAFSPDRDLLSVELTDLVLESSVAVHLRVKAYGHHHP